MMHFSIVNPVNVTYPDPPEVTAERDWVHAGEGEEVILVCKVYANPPPRVSWYKNTMKLIEGERTHLQVETHNNPLTLILTAACLKAILTVLG
jgi:hypothetical protein